MSRPNVREQLIEAGLRTLHLHGFNGCGVQDIRNAAGRWQWKHQTGSAKTVPIVARFLAMKVSIPSSGCVAILWPLAPDDRPT